jgi:hypothetical protein
VRPFKINGGLLARLPACRQKRYGRDCAQSYDDAEAAEQIGAGIAGKTAILRANPGHSFKDPDSGRAATEITA